MEEEILNEFKDIFKADFRPDFDMYEESAVKPDASPSPSTELQINTCTQPARAPPVALGASAAFRFKESPAKSLV